MKRFWDVIIPQEAVWNWHIEVMCSEFQKVAERVFRNEPSLYDLLINVPPGSTKSTVFSVLAIPWVWTRMKTARFICGSYAYPLAMDLSRKSRDVIQSEKYNRLFGHIELREDQNTKGYFVNTSGGDRLAVGVGGSVTGFHAHFILVDDPLDPAQAVSKAELKVANRWMDETLSTRKVDKAVTVTTLIMQRLNQDDPAGQRIKKAKEGGQPLRHICLPAEITPATRHRVRPRSLARKYVDGLLDPARISRSVLEKVRSALGEYGYAGQYLQHPVPLAGGAFRVDQLTIHTTAPRMIKVVRYWDKAGTAKAGCWTVGLKMGIDSDRCYWVLDIRRGQWEANERERIIRQTAILDGKDILVAVEQEPGSGGKESAQNTLKNLAGFRVKLDRPVGDKELRADPYAVQVNGGNVKLLRGDWNTAYVDELQFFPYSSFKDQVDASSGSFAMLIKSPLKMGGLF